ncbi:MAG TPA: winged-helix domain-containing protein, partial [Nitrososphaeraceae archaeon]|nr:winged-helix domain-containing protein [Nitrososphaeraceae archaeon]
MSSREIERNLQDIGYKITERAVRYRIRKLETSNTVLGYSTILNPSFVSERVNRTVILKFKYSYNASTLIDRLENYVQEASFCVYSARL